MQRLRKGVVGNLFCVYGKIIKLSIDTKWISLQIQTKETVYNVSLPKTEKTSVLEIRQFYLFEILNSNNVLTCTDFFKIKVK